MSGYAQNSNATAVSLVEVLQETPNIWQATVTTEPSQVFFDGVRGIKVASVALCNSAGKWYWENNILYVYSDSDPDTAFTSPGIEPASRSQTISSTDKNYVTIENLETKYTNESALTGSITINGGTNVILSSLTIHDNDGKSAVRLYGDGNSKTIQNSTIYNQKYSVEPDPGDHARKGYGIGLDGPGDNYLVTGNTIYNNNACGIELTMSGTDFGSNFTISNTKWY